MQIGEVNEINDTGEFEFEPFFSTEELWPGVCVCVRVRVSVYIYLCAPCVLMGVLITCSSC